MTTYTPLLGIPLLVQNQLAKPALDDIHRRLEVMSVSVLTRANGGPPVSPSSGDRYIVDVASGAWTGMPVGSFADYWLGSWRNYYATEGLIVWDIAAAEFVSYTGGAWEPLGVSPVSSSGARSVISASVVYKMTDSTIPSSHNVLSVANTGNTEVQVNFIDAMASTEYAVLAMVYPASDPPGTSYPYSGIVTSRKTTYCKVKFVRSAGGNNTSTAYVPTRCFIAVVEQV